MLSKKVVVIIFTLIAVLAYVGVFSNLTFTQQITSIGQIVTCGVGVYQNQMCTTALTSISWGEVNPGASVICAAYLENTGDSNVTLSLAESNWSPTSASSVLTLVWNAPAILEPSQVVAVNFTLTASESTGTLAAFSFDIDVMGTAP
jgi:hypothetical protein